MEITSAYLVEVAESSFSCRLELAHISINSAKLLTVFQPDRCMLALYYLLWIPGLCLTLACLYGPSSILLINPDDLEKNKKTSKQHFLLLFLIDTISLILNRMKRFHSFVFSLLQKNRQQLSSRGFDVKHE